MKDPHTTSRPAPGHSTVARHAYGGGRLTAGRIAIVEAIVATAGAFTVDDLVALLRKDTPSLSSQATVYRAVAALVETGFIERVGTRGGGALYTRCECAESHHHHIVCDGCGKTIEADCPLGPRIAADAAAHGFTILRHEMTLYGLCASCAPNGRVA